MKKRGNEILRAPYLRKIWIEKKLQNVNKNCYPFSLPFLKADSFELNFIKSVTIIVGENGSGKSTLLEGIASLAGYDEAGGGKGYRPVDHSRAIETQGGNLSKILKASWLPKVTDGWFFRSESFFSVSRYLDEAAIDSNQPAPDFLSYSHGEGFLRFFDERCKRKGIYIFDEPESALSPKKQLDFLKIIRQMDDLGVAQIIMATHSPILMAYPGACLLKISGSDISEVDIFSTEHFRIMSEFCLDPKSFIRDAML